MRAGSGAPCRAGVSCATTGLRANAAARTAAEAKYLRTGWSPLKQVGAPQRYATPLHCSSLKCGIAADQFFSLSTSLLAPIQGIRSEEHTSELQSLMRISYAVFCLKKKKN